MSKIVHEVGVFRFSLFFLALLLLFLPGFPWKPLVVLVLLNLALRENYPFSHYPMFSSFARSTEYIFVTDEHDEPIATLPEFGVSAVIMRKSLMVELHQRPRGDRSDAEFQKECGRAILERFATQRGNRTARTLRLHRVSIQLRDGEFNEHCECLAEGRF